MKGETGSTDNDTAAIFREMSLRWGEKLGAAIPEGYLLVPIVPTNAMDVAGLQAIEENIVSGRWLPVHHIWNAMLRAMCIAAKEGWMTDSTNFRQERIEKLLHELEYEVTRGMLEKDIGEEMGFRFYVPLSNKIPDGVVFCEFRTRPVHRGQMTLDAIGPRLRIVKPSHESGG